jgi:hypothetical protein
VEEIIGRILEIDELERNIIKNAENARAGAETIAIKRKEAFKAQYLERAKKRIEILKEAETVNAEEALKQRVEENTAQIKRLNAMFAQNADKWAEELFRRVIVGSAELN